MHSAKLVKKGDTYKGTGFVAFKNAEDMKKVLDADSGKLGETLELKGRRLYA